MDECMFNNPSAPQTLIFYNNLNITNSVNYGTELITEPFAWFIKLYITNTSFYNSNLFVPCTIVLQSTFVSSNVEGFILLHLVINESLLIDSTLNAVGEWSIYNTVSNNTIISVYGSLYFMNSQLYMSQVFSNASNDGYIPNLAIRVQNGSLTIHEGDVTFQQTNICNSTLSQIVCLSPQAALQVTLSGLVIIKY